MKKKIVLVLFAAVMMSTGCSKADTPVQESSEVQNEDAGSSEETEEAAELVFDKIHADQWLYNEEDDVYYQVQLLYCEDPADAELENLAVFVPGGYFAGTANGDGTYTCEINEAGAVGNYTAVEAPVSFAVYTPGYMECAPVSEYVDFTRFTDAGMIHVYSGCRGRDAGAPSGVADLKAAIRYLRYNAENLPGDMNQIYAFGMSGGGAQCSLLASSGNSADYDPYLEAIGAVVDHGDEITGAMCWCPVTNLDTANEAYEWEMGSSRIEPAKEQQDLSGKMAAAYAEYVNKAGFQDENGTILTLEASDAGVYQAGTYYDYIKSVIEDSLNTFLAETEFPYDADFIRQASLENGRQKGTAAKAVVEEPTTRENWVPLAEREDAKEAEKNTEETDVFSGVYETVQDYIDALNADTTWVLYDDSTNTATITSVADFAAAVKQAEFDVGAFDALDGISDRNEIFGAGKEIGSHFDAIFAGLLADTEYSEAFEKDFSTTDFAGNTVLDVVNFYTPLNYLMESYEGYHTADVARYWRIRSGISQENRTISSEVNLVLALMNYDAVESLDYATIWGQKHIQAEAGAADSVGEYIKWVETCVNGQTEN